MLLILHRSSAQLITSAYSAVLCTVLVHYMDINTKTALSFFRLSAQGLIIVLTLNVVLLIILNSSRSKHGGSILSLALPGTMSISS